MQEKEALIRDLWKSHSAAPDPDEAAWLLQTFRDELGIDESALQSLLSDTGVDRRIEDASLGARHNYDYPAKRAWRERYLDFVAGHFSAEELKLLRVLGLFGRELLDVGELMRIGIDPRNIYAIERDRAVWPEFEARARALGINPIFGDLSKVVKTVSGTFGLFVLDWTGAISMNKVQTVQALQLAEKCCLVTNLAGKREGKGVQWQLGHGKRYGTVIGALRTHIGAENGVVEWMLNQPEQSLPELREDFVEESLAALVQSGRLIESLNGSAEGREILAAATQFLQDSGLPVTDSDIYTIFDLYLFKSLATTECLYSTLTRYKPPDDKRNSRLHCPVQSALKALTGMRRVEEIERYGYASEPNHSPYISCFFFSRTPSREFELSAPFRRSAALMAVRLLNLAQGELLQVEWAVRAQNDQPKMPGLRLREMDQLVLTIEGEETGRISVRDYSALAEHLDQMPPEFFRDGVSRSGFPSRRWIDESGTVRAARGP